MKLHLLLETISDQKEQIAKRESLPAEDVQRLAAQINPKHWKWVVGQWFKGHISTSDLTNDDQSEVLRKLLNQFVYVTNNKRFSIDINRIGSVEDLKQFVNETLNKLAEQYGDGAHILEHFGDFTLFLVSSTEALENIGENSSWCTRGSYHGCQSERYIRMHGMVFVITKNHKPFIQFLPRFAQIKDANNDDIPQSQLIDLCKQYGIDIKKIAFSNSKQLLMSSKAAQFDFDQLSTGIFEVIKLNNEGMYEEYVEPYIVQFLNSRMFGDIDRRAELDFMVELKGMLSANRELKVGNHELTSTAELLEPICEFIYNRFHALSSQFVKDRSGQVVQGGYEVLEWPELKDVIVRMLGDAQPTHYTSDLAAHYYNYIGRYVGDTDSNKLIKDFAIDDINGIIELLRGSHQRIQEVEDKYINYAKEEIAQPEEHPVRIDELIMYFEFILGTHFINLNDPLTQDKIKQLRGSKEESTLWPEYEEILFRYPVNDGSEPVQYRLITQIDAIVSYMVMHGLHADDRPILISKVLSNFKNFISNGVARYNKDLAIALSKLNNWVLEGTEYSNAFYELFQEYADSIGMRQETMIKTLDTLRPSQLSSFDLD